MRPQHQNLSMIGTHLTAPQNPIPPRIHSNGTKHNSRMALKAAPLPSSKQTSLPVPLTYHPANQIKPTHALTYPSPAT
jgi:hypothetical protein